jgi:hypothetical protein
VVLASELRPDVVTLDLLMPMMDGHETAQAILRTSSPGILVVAQDRRDADRLLCHRAPSFSIRWLAVSAHMPPASCCLEWVTTGLLGSAPSSRQVDVRSSKIRKLPRCRPCRGGHWGERMVAWWNPRRD